MRVNKKHPYEAPTLMTVHVASAKLFAASGDPQVHTSNEKASNGHEALVKEQGSNNIWDESW